MTEEELEAERWIDDDYAVVSQFYSAKRRYPNIPFYCLLYTSAAADDLL